MGDVALLSADIVGPGGRVLGIDRDAAALDNARRRAEEQGCSSWVEFQASNLDEFADYGSVRRFGRPLRSTLPTRSVFRYPLPAAFRETGRHRRLP